MLIKYVYTFFLALLLALFVGVGISVFYPEPEQPRYPEPLTRALAPGEYHSKEDRVEIEKQRKMEIDFQKKREQFEKRSGIYNRNVSIISLAASIITVVVTLTIFKRVPVIADGLLLGGIFILGYSIIRGFTSNDDRLRFFVISVGLAMTLIVGYLKFIKTEETSDS
jgi:hypothetical protein